MPQKPDILVSLVSVFIFLSHTAFAMTPSPVSVALDDWESGDTLSGGVGNWTSAWLPSGSGDYLIFTSEEPYEGSYQLRLNKNVSLERSVDMTSITGIPFLDFAYKGKRMSGTGYVDIWDGDWQRVHSWGDDDILDFTWYTTRINLSSYDWNRADFKIRLGYDNNRRNFVYFDVIEIVSATLPDPVTVSLASPVDGSTTTTIDPLLSWSADNPAETYFLMVDDDPGFGSPIVDLGNLTASSHQTSGLDPDTLYYWRVKAEVAGTAYSWSSVWSFTSPALAMNSLLIQAEDFTSSIDNTPGNNDLIYKLLTDTDINYDHSDIDGTTMFYGITSEGKRDIRVQNIETGEELTYEIAIPATDTWKITFNGFLNFDLYIDGTLYATNQGVAPGFNITNYFSNQNMVVENVELTQGLHTIRIVANNGVHDYNGMQLDFILFESTTNPPPPLVKNTKPYNDSAPPAPPAGYISPVSQYGQLYVDGPHLKSSVTGEVARLRFAALHGQKWFPVIKNNTIYNMAYKENIQGIRLAMYAEYGTYDDPDNQVYLKAKTLEIIEDCIGAGLYVEIDYHVHASDWQIGGKAYTLEQEFFSWLMAQAVIQAQPENIIYSVVNEIVSGTWSQARPYIQDMVDLIRQTDPDNIILSGTPFFSQNPDDVIGNQIVDANTMYTFHMYTASHSLSIVDNVIASYDTGLPIWANEISPGHYDWQVQSYNFVNFDSLINTLETRGIPWSNWQWSMKGETLSAFNWNANYYGPWTDSDFSAGGLYIRDKFAAPFPEIGSSIGMDVNSLTSTCQAQGPNNTVRVEGNIRDENSSNLAGVSVSYTFTGDVTGSGSVTTDVNGNFTATSSKKKNAIATTFSVDSIALNGYSDDDSLFMQARNILKACP